MNLLDFKHSDGQSYLYMIQIKSTRHVEKPSTWFEAIKAIQTQKVHQRKRNFLPSTGLL